MKEPIKSILKLIFVGMATTVVRIIGQLSIPAGEQTVLAPSIFAQNGIMPAVFYDLRNFRLPLIAALFLLIRKRVGGNRIWQGLRYGLACCAVWIVYLFRSLCPMWRRWIGSPIPLRTAWLSSSWGCFWAGCSGKQGRP